MYAIKNFEKSIKLLIGLQISSSLPLMFENLIKLKNLVRDGFQELLFIVVHQ
jgi:hypothetical protein